MLDFQVPPLQIDPLVPTVYHSNWWLSAATGGCYEEVDLQAGGRTIARFPYVVQRKLTGHRLCTMPPLTPFLGPAIDLTCKTAANRNRETVEIVRQLLARMSRFDGFYHKLHSGTANTLGFEDMGCATGVQFNYEIAPQPEEAIWRGMRAKTRNVIRRAELRWQVAEVHDPEAFASVYEANLRSRGVATGPGRIAAVCAAAVARDAGRMLAIKDAHGRVLAAIFTVWDRRAAFYRFSTRAPGSENGLVSLLVWHAIREAARRGQVFDFDGIGYAGSRLFLSGFGGETVHRYYVSSYSRSYRIARMLKGGWTELRGLPGRAFRRLNVRAPA